MCIGESLAFRRILEHLEPRAFRRVDINRQPEGQIWPAYLLLFFYLFNCLKIYLFIWDRAGERQRERGTLQQTACSVRSPTWGSIS